MGGYKIQFAFLHCRHTLYSTWGVQCKLFGVELSAIELTANVKKLQPAHSERCSAVQSLHIRVECTQFSDFTTLTCGCYPSNPTPPTLPCTAVLKRNFRFKSFDVGKNAMWDDLDAKIVHLILVNKNVLAYMATGESPYSYLERWNSQSSKKINFMYRTNHKQPYNT